MYRKLRESSQGVRVEAQKKPPPVCSLVAGRGFLLQGAGPVYCVPYLLEILSRLTSVDSSVLVISQNGPIIELEGISADPCSRAAEQSCQPFQIEHIGTLSFHTSYVTRHASSRRSTVVLSGSPAVAAIQRPYCVSL